MVLCQYNFVLPVEPSELMGLAKQAIIENGGVVSGDLPNFSLSVHTPLGQFSGDCNLIADSTIHIVVTQKPELVSCDLIRDKLVELLKQGVKKHQQMSRGNR